VIVRGTCYPSSRGIILTVEGITGMRKCLDFRLSMAATIAVS
jgi:hypothetical protein